MICNSGDRHIRQSWRRLEVWWLSYLEGLEYNGGYSGGYTRGKSHPRSGFQYVLKSVQLQSFVRNSNLVGGRSAIREETPVDCFICTEINTDIQINIKKNRWFFPSVHLQRAFFSHVTPFPWSVWACEECLYASQFCLVQDQGPVCHEGPRGRGVHPGASGASGWLGPLGVATAVPSSSLVPTWRHQIYEYGQVNYFSLPVVLFLGSLFDVLGTAEFQ